MIRKAKSEDVIQIAEIYRQYQKKQCEIINDNYIMPQNEFFFEDVYKNLADFFVCERDERIVGYARTNIAECEKTQTKAYMKYCVIKQIAISENFLRLQAGSELIKFIREFAEENHCISIRSDIWYENYDAVDFYGQMGFIPINYEMEIKLNNGGI